jgi:hypothetical protein
MVIIAMILDTIWECRLFGMVYSMTGGGPGYAGQVLSLLTYKHYFQFSIRPMQHPLRGPGRHSCFCQHPYLRITMRRRSDMKGGGPSGPNLPRPYGDGCLHLLPLLDAQFFVQDGGRGSNYPATLFPKLFARWGLLENLVSGEICNYFLNSLIVSISTAAFSSLVGPLPLTGF